MSTQRSKYSVRPVLLEEWETVLEGRSYALYYASWWLREATSGGERLLYVCWRDLIHPVAVLAAVMRYGQIILPAYCQYTDVLFLDEEINATTRQSLIRLIHSALPPHNYLYMHCPPASVDSLAYHWMAYKQTTRYNYVWDVRPYTTVDEALSSITHSLRRNTRVAQRAGYVYDAEISVAEALSIFDYTSRYKGYKADLEILEQLIQVGKGRHQALLVGIRDALGGALAMAALIVVHQRRAYLIAEGTNREVSGRHHLKSLLLIHFVAEHRDEVDFIDFEGSMLEPIATIYQGIGASQQLFHSVWQGRRRNLSYFRKKFLIPSIF